MPKVVDKKEKARMIADTAVKVFRKMGFQKARVEDVAREAGIGKGTFYEYFKNKEDVLRFAFNEYFSVFTAGMVDAMDKAEKSADRLFIMIDFALQHVESWEDHCAVYFDFFGNARTDENERLFLSSIYEQMEGILTDIIRQSQDSGEIDSEMVPKAVASILMSLYDGVIMQRIFRENMVDRESINKTAVKILSSGLMPEVKIKE